MTSNAQVATEFAELHAALIQRAAVTDANTTASTLPVMERVSTIDGSGAGSPELYQEIMKLNGHGRLGRTHMEDVDRLVETARNELDNYLRRTIRTMMPVGGSYQGLNADVVFATLSAFGLRLEDRGPLADLTIFDDSGKWDAATIMRLQNFSAHYYTAQTNKYDNYWKGYALETLIELARYRGLFSPAGFLKTT